MVSCLRPSVPTRRRVRTVVTAALAAGVTATAIGCALKDPPDAAALKEQALPGLHAPAQYTAAGARVAAASVDNWLAGFNDPQLAEAVAEAIAHNADLRVGAARVEQAQLYAKLAGARLYPSIDLLAKGGGKLSGDGSGLQGGVLSASWELDLWGRVRYGRSAAAFDAASAAADFEFARQSLAALVAKNWFLATEASLQLEAARETIRASETLAGLAGDRFRVGAGDQAEVFTTRGSVGGYRDIARQLELGREQAIRGLEVLLGRYPAAAAALSPRLPALPGGIPAGLPSELLERRPDVVAAERRVAAAFHRIHEAKAARLPAISLTSSLSAISSSLFVLQDRDNPSWSAGGSLVAPIYRGGELKTRVEIRTAEQKQAVAAYAAVGLRAFSEVETALASEIAASEREQILAQALADNEQALTVLQSQFKVGSADLRAVSNRQLAVTSARSALIRVQADQRVQRVNLHLALGGSFELPPAAPPPATANPSPGAGR
jgi:NodT family efflux transporter outer membrane factor (OMF) lipoprotein